jgi:integrase
MHSTDCVSTLYLRRKNSKFDYICWIAPNLPTARIGTHTLRKTFGYHFYQEHKDIGLLQYLFNHSSQRVTLQELINSKLRNFAL